MRSSPLPRGGTRHRLRLAVTQIWTQVSPRRAHAGPDCLPPKRRKPRGERGLRSAGGGSRTHTSFRGKTDFESVASASSATPAGVPGFSQALDPSSILALPQEPVSLSPVASASSITASTLHRGAAWRGLIRPAGQSRSAGVGTTGVHTTSYNGLQIAASLGPKESPSWGSLARSTCSRA
jgi:hypothetical protein